MRITRLAAIATCLTALTACGTPGFSGHESVAQYLSPAMRAPLAHRAASYLGVYEPGVPRSYGLVQHFTDVAGHRPNLVLFYSNWGKPFDVTFADQLLSHGALPLVQIDPGTVSLQAIADGQYDSYLQSYALQVRAFGRPVVMGFAREMNGWWYPWAYGHLSAVTWKSAWRHIVTLFRAHGATNVTWQWTINNVGTGIGPPQDWWPGASYVNWVGIDGYYYTTGSNFVDVFEKTIRAVRRFTPTPILVSEVAIGPSANPVGQIPALFQGIRQNHLLGLVWFDAPAHQDWRLEDNPPALAAFRRELATILTPAY
jgi:mannan endo-1,4-beta-mannosidase